MGFHAHAASHPSQAVLVAAKRSGTQTFLDVPLDQREKDFESQAGRFLLETLPADIEACLLQAVLETGIQSRDGMRFLQAALGDDRYGQPISRICRWLQDEPPHPGFWLTLYGEQDAHSALDRGCLLTSSAQAIELRLQAVRTILPALIVSERAAFGLPEHEPYRVFTTGAVHSLATIRVLYEHPHLKPLLRVICVDADRASLDYARRTAQRLGVDCCCEFLPQAAEAAVQARAHLLLVMGRCESLPSPMCVRLLRQLRNCCQPDALILFSTLQEAMLYNGPIFDFMMWAFGWRMCFKNEHEPAKIARSAGLLPETQLEWSDPRGFCRISAARVTRSTGVVRLFREAVGLARLLL
jgi:hypothetical protein